jgi:UPF0271 protein
MTVDLNADVGEGAGEDDAVMAGVTSVNVACGVHAGSRALMAATLAVARNRGLAVGAHPGYADRAGSGRRELDLTSAEITALVADQIRSLDELAAAAGVSLAHVKPHGALYNQAVYDERIARAVVEGVRAHTPAIAVFAPPESALLRAAGDAGLRGVREAFADRSYQANGRLVPRSQPGAVITDQAAVVERARRLVLEGTLTAASGEVVAVPCDTICVHADTPGAAALARAIRDDLMRAGVWVGPPRVDRT